MKIKQEDAQKFKRILAIGDIHGEYEMLVKLWDKIKFKPEEDLLIFLGDYTDRGPESVKCTRFIRKVAQMQNVIPLMGNHERMLMDYIINHPHIDMLNSVDINDCWMINGGLETLRDFAKNGVKELYEWFHFANTLPVFVDVDDMFFCHAGIAPDRSINDQDTNDMLWIREDFYNNYHGDKLIVVGHTPVQYLIDTDEQYTPVYIDDNNILMCDTGAFLGGTVGRLSCINVLDMKEIYSVGDESKKH